MGDGKIAFAPCGHRGEHIIGSYVQCLFGCDEEQFDDLKTLTGVPKYHYGQRFKTPIGHATVLHDIEVVGARIYVVNNESDMYSLCVEYEEQFIDRQLANGNWVPA